MLVRELFDDLGVSQHGQWARQYLCAAPQERVFLHGRWQEDSVLQRSAMERDQWRRFTARMQQLRATGHFTIPMELGATPSPLDRLSFAEWCRQKHFDAPFLTWYLNYACRDDYGALATETSAWAGIHYFASREYDELGPFTWPEGNGWIIRRLLATLQRYVQTATMVYHIAPAGRGLQIWTDQSAYLAEIVIFAAPTFLASYIVEGMPPLRDFVYSPWLTANLTLERRPRERGVDLAWDNTLYDSPTLGYVVATHQTRRAREDRSVWTVYWALAEGTPAQNRQWLLAKDWQYWKEAILHELSRAHPDIRACVSRLDIMRLGHGMIRPPVGFLGSAERQRLAHHTGRLFFANSDLSGLSLFEEAQYRGVKAAEHALAMVGGSR